MSAPGRRSGAELDPSTRRTRERLPIVVGFSVAAVALLVVAPLALDAFRLNQLAQYLCFGLVAVGIGLAWGRGGMLTLGQGVFFGLGAYLMAMHMTLADAGPGGTPAFMSLISSDGVPWWWEPLRSPVVTVLLILLLPTLLAAGLGLATFRRRIRGPYFAILSQALAAAFAILLVGNPTTTGGSSGLTDFVGLFGWALGDPANRTALYLVVAIILLLTVYAVHRLMESRFGELLVACRDSEERVRFLGYDPALIKTAAFAFAALTASVGGALFVPVVGIISPTEVGVVASIGMVIGVAIGGRATLAGPVLGAVAVAWAETSLSEQFPSGWTYAQGLLFMLVVAFLPGGLASLFVRRRRAAAGDGATEPAITSGASRGDG